MEHRGPEDRDTKDTNPGFPPRFAHSSGGEPMISRTWTGSFWIVIVYKLIRVYVFKNWNSELLQCSGVAEFKSKEHHQKIYSKYIIYFGWEFFIVYGPLCLFTQETQIGGVFSIYLWSHAWYMLLRHDLSQGKIFWTVFLYFENFLPDCNILTLFLLLHLSLLTLPFPFHSLPDSCPFLI